MTSRAACDMVFEKSLTKGVEGLIGQRHKTIILLRVSTVAKQGPKGRAKRPAQRFAGEFPQLFLLTQRTQQNDIGFVALAEGLGGWPPGFFGNCFSIKYKIGGAHSAAAGGAVDKSQTVHSGKNWASKAGNSVDIRKIRGVIFWQLNQLGK